MATKTSRPPQSAALLPSWKVALFWLALLLALGWFLSAVSSILLPFVAGILLAYMLDPVVDRLELRRYSRTTATFMVLGLTLFILVLALVLILPPAIDQLTGFASALPEMYAKTRGFVQSYSERILSSTGLINGQDVQQTLNDAITSQGRELLGTAGGMVNNIWKSGLTLINLVSLLLITPLVAFYFLRDWDRIKSSLDSLLPRRHAPTIRSLAEESDRVISGFVRGQMNVCLILAAYYAVALTIAGLPYGLLIGLAGGLLAFVPYVGTATGMLAGAVVAWLDSQDILYVGIILAIFGVAQFVEGNFLTPKLVGDKVGLHPVWVIFGMLAGGALLGLVGVLIAVPLSAVIGVLVRFAVVEYRASPFYTGKPPARSRG